MLTVFAYILWGFEWANLTDCFGFISQVFAAFIAFHLKGDLNNGKHIVFGWGLC